MKNKEQMHKIIDSKFAIAILALVAACLGFALYFNAYSITSNQKVGKLPMQKPTTDEGSLETSRVLISVPQAFLTQTLDGKSTTQIKGTVVSVGECPPCDTSGGVVCSICAEVPVIIQEGSTAEEFEISVFITQAQALSKGQSVVIVADTLGNDYHSLEDVYESTELGFTAKVDPAWENMVIESQGSQSKNRSVMFDFSDTYGSESRYSMEVLHFDTEPDLKSAINLYKSELGSQFPDRQATNAENAGEFDQIYTVSSDAQNLVFQKAFKQKGLTLYMLSGDGTANFKAFYEQFSFL